MKDKIQTIAIAGASGYLGSHLIEWILTNTEHEIVAISRNNRTSSNPRLKWLKADLFSLIDIETVLQKVDVSIYLAHSVFPTADLDQGNPRIYDELLLDNFITASNLSHVTQVLYFGDGHLNELLKKKSDNFTALSSGPIIGNGSAPFNILYRIATIVPIHFYPKWSKLEVFPIDVTAVIDTIGNMILSSQHKNKEYFLRSNDRFKFYELLEVMLKRLQRKPIKIFLPFNLFYLSLLWFSFFSKASKELLSSLFSQRSHPGNTIKDLVITNEKSYEEQLKLILKEEIVVNYTPAIFKRKLVRSIQRVHLPQNKDALWCSQEYMRWLPSFMSPFVRVLKEKNKIYFCLLSKKIKILELTYSVKRSYDSRCFFYVTGGLLAQSNPDARLTFRESYDNKHLFTALHDFHPALPWTIYRMTQAVVHSFVMWSFGRHLKKMDMKNE